VFHKNMLPSSSGSGCIESGFLCICSTVLITNGGRGRGRGRGDRVRTDATSGPVDQESCASWNFLHTRRPLNGPSPRPAQSPVPTSPEEAPIPTPSLPSINDFQNNTAHTWKLTSLHISTQKMETACTSRSSEKLLISTPYQ
jgi:hypothetical protein